MPSPTFDLSSGRHFRWCSAPKGKTFHIRSRIIAKGTIISADEGSAWDALHTQYEMERLNHGERCVSDAGFGMDFAMNQLTGPLRD